MSTRRDLRLALCRERITLDRRARDAAARRISSRLALEPEYRRSRRIAVYLAVNGELDCAPLIHAAQRHGKQIYLPCIQADGHLRFRRWTPATRTRANRFGIPEPESAALPFLEPRRLDLVLMPLVGFDAFGTRLGMGGGYYDRTFAWLRHVGTRHTPRLVGLAHDFQRIHRLTRAAWDVPLDGVVTPSRFHRFVRR